jgi:hypothetical protein
MNRIAKFSSTMPSLAAKKRQNHGNKVALVFTQHVIPMRGVTRQVNLFRAPKAVHLFFVHVPDIVVLDGEQHIPVMRFGQQQFRHLLFCDRHVLSGCVVLNIFISNI